jgi:hypothetical protein
MATAQRFRTISFSGSCLLTLFKNDADSSYQLARPLPGSSAQNEFGLGPVRFKAHSFRAIRGKQLL